MLLPKSLSFNLEPTFRCNLSCPMCPRFSSDDPHLDMAAATYSRIVEHMNLAHTVDFTGWGEPLLHPAIYEMIRQAKAKGCVTTMTSNGTALTERNAARLIDSGLDHLTVSIDGIRPETYNAIRQGADFARVTANLCGVAGMISKSRASLHMGIAFTIQEQNAADLDLIVPWIQSVGAGTLHLKHLNAVSNGEDWDRGFLKYRLQPLARRSEALDLLEAKVREVRGQCERAGIRFWMHSEFPLTPLMVGRHCLATPLQSIYFSFEGLVSPCCHFGHHVSRFFDGRFIKASSLSLGDIRRQNLDEVWTAPDYQDFRAGFTSGEFPEACKTCYLLYGK